MKYKVTPFEPPSRWHVKSDTRPDIVHLVDVLENNGFGQCSCEHHQFRIQPEIDGGRVAGLARCKHLEMSREAFADFMIQRLLSPL